MNQIAMEFPGLELPPSAAISAIDDALKAEFPERARQFALTHLRRHGPTSGEDITDAMELAGIVPPGGDGRKYGPVIQMMAQRGLIEHYGVTYRRKGNGTLGAVIWRLTDKGLGAAA